MILAQSGVAVTVPMAECRVTLDDLFRRAGVHHADQLALIDQPDRRTAIGGEPLRLTYAEADRVVSAIATRLRELGLSTDTIVAFQLPNTAESILTLLGILRAGMIAVPLPVLWRKADMIAALSQIGAKALIAADRIADFAGIDTAMQVAAELFPIRFLCAFGDNLPDGIVPLGDLLAPDAAPPMTIIERAGEPSAHVAVITWEMTGGGPIPVARSHAELVAGGLHVHQQMQAERAGTTANMTTSIMSATPISSFAGLALTVVPWLLSGGTCVLHHGLAPKTFAAQSKAHLCDTVVLAAPLIGPLTESGFFAGDRIRNVIAFWRSPEQLATAAPWQDCARLIDVAVFGEIGLVAVPRNAPLPGHVLQAGRYGAFIELARNDAGTLCMRGAMTPSHNFPPGAPADGIPHLDRTPAGFIDTGNRCRFEQIDGTLAVTSPPPDLVVVGGYRLPRKEVDSIGALLGPDSTLAVLPNALTGQRLAGNTTEPKTMAELLAGEGLNALIAAAFRRTATIAA